MTTKTKVDTSLKEIEDIFRRKTEELELFSYMASHDLREPLQKILGFGALLETALAKQELGKADDYLKRIRDATVRMDRLVSDLLQFSLIEKKDERYEVVDLGELTETILQALGPRIKDEGAQIRVGALPAVHADRAQMRQLFQNLISNALKFRAKDRPAVITIESRAIDSGNCEIAVSDNGIGFEEKFVEKIFKPFIRLHSRSQYDGSGLGLAICQKIVAQHRGTIRAESRLNEGSTFIVCLPKGDDKKGAL